MRTPTLCYQNSQESSWVVRDRIIENDVLETSLRVGVRGQWGTQSGSEKSANLAGVIFQRVLLNPKWGGESRSLLWGYRTHWGWQRTSSQETPSELHCLPGTKCVLSVGRLQTLRWNTDNAHLLYSILSCSQQLRWDEISWDSLKLSPQPWEFVILKNSFPEAIKTFLLLTPSYSNVLPFLLLTV